MSELHRNILVGITINGLDVDRCHQKCQFIEKKQGLYTCTLFNKVVDGVGHEDDEKGYGFGRVVACVDLEIGTQNDKN